MIVIDEHFYRTCEAAEELGVERHTIGRWIQEGKLEAQKVATVTLIDKGSVARLKAERAKPSW